MSSIALALRGPRIRSRETGSHRHADTTEDPYAREHSDCGCTTRHPPEPCTRDATMNSARGDMNVTIQTSGVSNDISEPHEENIRNPEAQSPKHASFSVNEVPAFNQTFSFMRYKDILLRTPLEVPGAPGPRTWGPGIARTRDRHNPPEEEENSSGREPWTHASKTVSARRGKRTPS